MDLLEGDSESLEVLEDLEKRLLFVPKDDKHIRLRGFLLVERMLGYLDEVFNNSYVGNQGFKRPVRLNGRTWGDLTNSKNALDAIIDELKIDDGEAVLSGKRDEDQVTYKTGEVELLGETISKATLGSHISHLAKIAVNAIRVLRPYLRNDKVSVSVLGDHIADFMLELYGTTAPKMVEVSKEIMEAKA